MIHTGGTKKKKEGLLFSKQHLFLSVYFCSIVLSGPKSKGECKKNIRVFSLILRFKTILNKGSVVLNKGYIWSLFFTFYSIKFLPFSLKILVIILIWPVFTRKERLYSSFKVILGLQTILVNFSQNLFILAFSVKIWLFCHLNIW